MLIDLSVIFPYYNEEKTILDTLNLISNQTIMPNEVIFVNSSSSDTSSEIINNWIIKNKKYYKTKFFNIFEHTNTPSSSKNIGIKKSLSNWVAFMDCGLIFELDWLENQWNFLKENKLEIVSGNVLLTGIGSIDQAAVSQTYGYKRLRPCIPSTIVKKTIFDQTGLFIDNRRAGYDFAWPILLKKLNISRGINKKVILKYNGINYGNDLLNILRKKIIYTKSTVGIKYHYLPYCFLSFLFFLSFFIIKFPIAIGPLFLIYIIFRGYLIPIKRSKGVSMFRNNFALFFWMPIVGIFLDIGGTIGIILGFIKYHIIKDFINKK